MILHGLSPETLARLLSIDRPVGDDDRLLLFGPTESFVMEAANDEDEPLRWAAE